MVVADGGSTNDTALDLSGTVSATLGAGEVLNVYDGSTLLGQAVVTGTTWTFTTPALAGGVHSFTTQVADAAGNTGAASSAYAVTVDTTAPTQTGTITNAADDVAPVTGNVPSGGTTNDQTLGLSGTLSAGLGAGAGSGFGAAGCGFTLPSSGPSSGLPESSRPGIARSRSDWMIDS